MDGSRFDSLAKALWVAGTRRSVVRLLTTAPILGALAAFLRLEASEATHPANRVLEHKEQRRRKARQARRKRSHQQHNQDRDQQANDGGGGGGDAPGGTGGFPCVPLDQVCSGLSKIPCCNPRGNAGTECLLTAAGSSRPVNANVGTPRGANRAWGPRMWSVCAMSKPVPG